MVKEIRGKKVVAEWEDRYNYIGDEYNDYREHGNKGEWGINAII